MKIDHSANFKKAYKKRIAKDARLRELFVERVALFIESPNHPFLKTHSLSGNLKGYHSFRIDYDYRVVFEYINDDHVLFTNIGTHDQVY